MSCESARVDTNEAGGSSSLPTSPSPTWAIESACGETVLAQQLVAARDTVLDVPPTLRRARLLDTTCTDKTDAHDARAAAIVALRHTRLRQAAAVDHAAVLGLRASTQRHVVRTHPP